MWFYKNNLHVEGIDRFVDAHVARERSWDRADAKQAYFFQVTELEVVPASVFPDASYLPAIYGMIDSAAYFVNKMILRNTLEQEQRQQLGNVQPDQTFFSFDEYLLCVASFASLTPPELKQFMFDLYDDDKSGSLDEHEFAKMSKELQSKQFSFPKNVANAIRMMEGMERSGALRDRGFTGDGLVDLPEFMRFARLFPVACSSRFSRCSATCASRRSASAGGRILWRASSRSRRS
ncbi:hypothetical protein PINS_up002710 [Pythium insidiosum]|nr:hypothetical protein PINS_up002710 [Pythium insidiosum]